MRRTSAALLCIIFFSFLITFTSCKQKPKEKDPNEVTNALKNLKSYRTDMYIEVKNSRQKLEYTAKQTYAKGLGYRLELGEDRVLLYQPDGEIVVKDKENNAQYSQETSFDEVYKLSFIGEYIRLLYTNEEIKYTFEEVTGKTCQLIDLYIPGGNKHLRRGVLYVNTRDNSPVFLKVYDAEEQERILIRYDNFTPDIEINKDEFMAEYTQ